MFGMHAVLGATVSGAYTVGLGSVYTPSSSIAHPDVSGPNKLTGTGLHERPARAGAGVQEHTALAGSHRFI